MYEAPSEHTIADEFRVEGHASHWRIPARVGGCGMRAHRTLLYVRLPRLIASRQLVRSNPGSPLVFGTSGAAQAQPSSNMVSSAIQPVLHKWYRRATGEPDTGGAGGLVLNRQSSRMHRCARPKSAVIPEAQVCSSQLGRLDRPSFWDRPTSAAQTGRTGGRVKKNLGNGGGQ